MIFDNLTFQDTKQLGVKFVLGIQCLLGVHFRRSFATIRDSSEKIQKEIRSAWTEVSSNNMLTTKIRTLIHHTGRECCRRAFLSPAIHNDHKRPKVAERDSWKFSENTHVKEGKNLLFKMCTLDAVMIGRPLFYGKTNDIVFFLKKCSDFLLYKCRKWHLKDNSAVFSEDLNMDVTWALLRMQLDWIMQSVISPDNMLQIFSFGGINLFYALQFYDCKKSDIVPWWKVTVSILLLCIQSWSMDKWLVMFGTARCRNHVWCGHLHPRKTNSNEVSRRIFKHRESSWRITHRTEIVSMLGMKFRYYVSDLGNILVDGLMIYITMFFNDFR